MIPSNVFSLNRKRSSLVPGPLLLVPSFPLFSYVADIEELVQNSELGWGTHEKKLPKRAFEHKSGTKYAIMLNKPGAAVGVRTWCPSPGAHFGELTTHHESLEMADFFTMRDPVSNSPIYRPTCFYAYHSCDDSVLSIRELKERELKPQPRMRIMLTPNVLPGGYDELGVLLMGSKRGPYWYFLFIITFLSFRYGFHLNIEDVKDKIPYAPINATTFSVSVGVMAAVVWTMKHSSRGVVEPVEMDHTEVMNFVQPHLHCKGFWPNWSPIQVC